MRKTTVLMISLLMSTGYGVRIIAADDYGKSIKKIDDEKNKDTTLIRMNSDHDNDDTRIVQYQKIDVDYNIIRLELK